MNKSFIRISGHRLDLVEPRAVPVLLETHFAITGTLLFFINCLLSCGTVQVYKEADKPIFSSNEQIVDTTGQADSLTVITFNIEAAEKIQLATVELEGFTKTRAIDIYMLQEVDEKAVESIARQLNLNYLYIPIVYNKLVKKNIGNAILSRGTIKHPEKLLLPHSKWVNNRRRHVTIGEVTIRQKKILVYSVHTETMMMSRKNRMDQVDTIIQHAKREFSEYKYVVIGGDFNTLYSEDAELVVEKFTASNFNWSTAAVGSTARAFFNLVKPTHDYIFSVGLEVMHSGKIETSRSSDHYPVFATFRY